MYSIATALLRLYGASNEGPRSQNNQTPLFVEDVSQLELLAQIIKRKMAFFGDACRNNKCNLVKTCILGMMSREKEEDGAPGCNTSIDTIKKWTMASLKENSGKR